MSKSKGNVLDPIDLIDGIALEPLLEKRTSHLMQPHLKDKIIKATQKQFPEGIAAYGTDALRFTFCALASTGRHIRFDMERLEGYHHFCNKLWNAARYVLMQTEGYTANTHHTPETVIDRWILSQLHRTIESTLAHFDQYRFDLGAKTLYDFTWNIFCDWYLELSKPLLSPNNTAAAIQGTKQTLLCVLETLVRLLHPIMPFITEEIWQQLKTRGIHGPDSLMLASYPDVESSMIDNHAEITVEWIQQLVLAVRQIRGEMNLSPSQALSLQLSNETATDKQLVQKHQTLLMNLAKISDINFTTDTSNIAATALAKHLTVRVPLAGLIDLTAERERLEKNVTKMQQDLGRAQQKLSNPAYCDKAPAEVVQKERQKVAELEDAIAKLQLQIQTIVRSV